jgi:hypothetical protein
MGALSKINPQTIQTGGNVTAVAIGAPALIYVGLRYAPTVKSKLVFAGVGALMLWANLEGLKAAYGRRTSSAKSPPAPAPEPLPASE